MALVACVSANVAIFHCSLIQVTDSKETTIGYFKDYSCEALPQEKEEKLKEENPQVIPGRIMGVLAAGGGIIAFCSSVYLLVRSHPILKKCLVGAYCCFALLILGMASIAVSLENPYDGSGDPIVPGRGLSAAVLAFVFYLGAAGSTHYMDRSNRSWKLDCQYPGANWRIITMIFVASACVLAITAVTHCHFFVQVSQYHGTGKTYLLRIGYITIDPNENGNCEVWDPRGGGYGANANKFRDSVWFFGMAMGILAGYFGIPVVLLNLHWSTGAALSSTKRAEMGLVLLFLSLCSALMLVGLASNGICGEEFLMSNSRTVEECRLDTDAFLAIASSILYFLAAISCLSMPAIEEERQDQFEEEANDDSLDGKSAPDVVVDEGAECHA